MKKIFASFFGLFFALQILGVHVSMANTATDMQTTMAHCQGMQMMEEDISDQAPQKTPQNMACCGNETALVISSNISAPEKKVNTKAPRFNFQKFLENLYTQSTILSVEKKHFKHNEPETSEISGFLAIKKITVLRV